MNYIHTAFSTLDLCVGDECSVFWFTWSLMSEITIVCPHDMVVHP